MALVVDDYLLLDLLAGEPAEWLRAESSSSAIYTTASWYYRLALAAHRGSGVGTLSGRIASMPERQREAALAAIDNLPSQMGLLPARLLVPVMAKLDVRRRPNLLTAEALAVALVVDGGLVVTVEAPLLRSGASDLGVPYRVAAP